MNKTEVYSWRVTSHTKSALETEARREGLTVSALLDRITKEWLKSGRRQILDEAEQERLQASVRKTIGTISGGNPGRAKQAGKAIRKRLRERHGR